MCAAPDPGGPRGVMGQTRARQICSHAELYSNSGLGGAAREGIQEDFISPDLAKRLLLILPTLKYTKVGAWETINLGAYYPYTGSPTQDPTAEIPVELQEFMDKANKDICSEFKVNQLTVNRYPCKGGCLTEHEDNEACIKVGSLILAGTLGDGKVLTFRDKMSNKEVDVNPPDKSVYIMSQTSQSLWTHRMERQKQNSSDGADGYQYTITARCVSAQNNNECIILGDSNTDHYKFGEDKGTFGWLLPGKRIPTMRIKHIDPEACIGYPNVNIHVGINDIRECAPPKFKAKTDALPKDIDTHVSNLVRKVNEIKRLSPGSRITVSSISMLPTKLPGLNRRALWPLQQPAYRAPSCLSTQRQGTDIPPVLQPYVAMSQYSLVFIQGESLSRKQLLR